MQLSNLVQCIWILHKKTYSSKFINNILNRAEYLYWCQLNYQIHEFYWTNDYYLTNIYLLYNHPPLFLAYHLGINFHAIQFHISKFKLNILWNKVRGDHSIYFLNYYILSFREHLVLNKTRPFNMVTFSNWRHEIDGSTRKGPNVLNIHKE